MIRLLSYVFLLILTQSAFAVDYPGKKVTWNGFDMYVDGENKIVVPAKAADKNPWVWRARFFGHEPQFDIAMLKQGYHLVYCDVSNLYGNTEAVQRWNAHYKFLREKLLLADKAVLEGFSRGGLIIYNWATENPEKVAAIYGDAPLMNFKHWPKIRPAAMKAYGFKNEQEARAYTKGPINVLEPLAKAKIPIIHVVGDDDKVVPVSKHTALAKAKYKALGGTFEVIHKPGVGHHPHSLKDPQPIVDFVLKYK